MRIFSFVDMTGVMTVQVYFTSGTTGSPKMVAHTHSSYGYCHQVMGKYWLDLTQDDIIIKPDGSPVTTRDLAGQVLYVMHLEQELGLHPGELRLCGEETSEILRGSGSSGLRDRIAGRPDGSQSLNIRRSRLCVSRKVCDRTKIVPLASAKRTC